MALPLRIKDVLEKTALGSSVTVHGWIRTKRTSRDFTFVALSDGSTQDTLQVFISKESSAYATLQRITTGAAIRVTGQLKDSPGKGQSREIDASDIHVYGEADAETYPLQKKGHSLEFLREIGHLRPRTNTFGAVFRIRNILSHAVHEFFQDRGFLWVHTPIITASDCEGAGDLFTVTSLEPADSPRKFTAGIDYSLDFFGKRAFLTVSGQLEAEFLAMSLGNVYTFGPTFRAENSNTSRHLSEFWMIEPEMAFADLSDDCDLAEDFIRFLCRAVLERGEKELHFLQKHYKTETSGELSRIAEKNFVRITYSEAIEELERSRKTFDFPVQWGADLQSEHERFLADNLIGGPVIVTDYPKEIKPFYMRLNDDGKTVAAMDILVPRIGEIIGGSQREERLDVLTSRMKEMGLMSDHLEWYLDLRRFGSAPHSGFGLGFERLVQFTTGMQNIRDVIACPRAPKTIKF